MNNWRLIPLIEASGAVQMAIDSWLLEQHRLGLHPPTLRFYTWSPVAISLGYHQHKWPEFWQDLTWQGKPIDIVRRPTGGRAVLHQGDMTYAIVTSGLAGSRMQVYRHLCEFLILGWRSLGVELHYGNAGRDYVRNPNCFGTATGADLVLATGAKLIGSAQLCRGNTVLQHGSIRLYPDLDLFERVFGEAKIVKIDALLHRQQDDLIPILINALTAAASRCFNAELKINPLTPDELQAIETEAILKSV